MSFDKRFYGIYRAICIDNEDPEGMGRITMQIPQVLGEAITTWADQITGLPNPDPGTVVWAMFLGGDPNFPLWIGASQ
jgi:hypothetical protein